MAGWFISAVCFAGIVFLLWFLVNLLGDRCAERECQVFQTVEMELPDEMATGTEAVASATLSPTDQKQLRAWKIVVH